MKTGILLINLGTPDSPSTGDVRKYLRQFLNDPRVIDISPLGRLLLVNLVIVPFRAPKSAKLYKSIWTEKGSPLLIHGIALKEKLQETLGGNYVVVFGMRYQNPSLGSALEELRKAGVSKIKIVPLYPQYASSSTGSTLEELMRLVRKWEVIPSLESISHFYDHPAFIRALTAAGKEFDHRQYDHVVFSYHGLPERQIKKAAVHYGNDSCSFGTCCDKITENNRYCYRANCFQTSRLLSEALGIPKEKYTISFQSRLGKTPWIKPYSDHVIEERAKKGDKKLLVFSPAFVADCLETVHEIGVEYNELFRKHGGEKVQLVPSLNSRQEWVQALQEILEVK
ncbi:MAG: ferrochelatase [Bacteroidetes bacterium]|nr:MAG: ferrochelatase [Bacteroidota bacterium]